MREHIHGLLMSAINRPEMAEYVFEGWQNFTRPKGRHLTFYTLTTRSPRGTQKLRGEQGNTLYTLQYRELDVQLDFWGKGSVEYMHDLALWLQSDRCVEWQERNNFYCYSIGGVEQNNEISNDGQLYERATMVISIRTVWETNEPATYIEQVEGNLTSIEGKKEYEQQFHAHREG